MYALTPGQGIIAHREAGGVLHSYVELKRSAEWIGGIDFADADAATLDGAELANAIAAHPDDVEAALTAYEESLFPRSESAYADAQQILELMLGDRAPHPLVELLTGAPLTA
jgi:thioredoxin-like negative regulator of GroEL